MQLWEWFITTKDGSELKHYTEEKAGIASESEMLAHIKKHYPNGVITKMRRISSFEKLGERIGPAKRHIFQCGAWDMGIREMAGLPATEKESLLDRVRRERAAALSGQRRDQIRPDVDPITKRIIPITQRIRPMVSY